ncbi:MAG: PhzF family phenazine biosynthesis protein [Xenococcaceae cyanobacterium]
MRYQFYTADVFTDRVFGGNQLAVFPNAQGLDSKQMQQVAREFNISETVFVFPPEKPEGDRRLRIFTPNTELPFAGHPTVGTAHILTAIGDIPLKDEVTTLVFEEGVGAVPVKVRAEGGKPVYAELTAAQLPEFGPEPPPLADLASMLSLEVSELLDGDNSPQAVSCGVPFLFIPLCNCNALGRVQLNRELWKQLLSSYWAPQVYVFTYDPELGGSDLRSRMFAPALGVEEDPATGSAATALAGYLGIRNELADGTLRWVVEQGFEMGRPSLLQVEADKENGKIKEIRVGGSSVLVSEGIMEIPKPEDCQ